MSDERRPWVTAGGVPAVTPQPRRRERRDARTRSTDKFTGRVEWVWRNIIPLAAIVIAAIAVRSATDELARVERQDRDAQRATAFRLCSRNMVDRAFAHARVGDAAGARAVRELENTATLPILDCAPNLRGRGARPLPAAAQRRFVERWRRKQLSPSELGVCPDTAVGSLPQARC